MTRMPFPWPERPSLTSSPGMPGTPSPRQVPPLNKGSANPAGSLWHHQGSRVAHPAHSLTSRPLCLSGPHRPGPRDRRGPGTGTRAQPGAPSGHAPSGSRDRVPSARKGNQHCGSVGTGRRGQEGSLWEGWDSGQEKEKHKHDNGPCPLHDNVPCPCPMSVPLSSLRSWRALRRPPLLGLPVLEPPDPHGLPRLLSSGAVGRRGGCQQEGSGDRCEGRKEVMRVGSRDKGCPVMRVGGG